VGTSTNASARASGSLRPSAQPNTCCMLVLTRNGVASSFWPQDFLSEGPCKPVRSLVPSNGSVSVGRRLSEGEMGVDEIDESNTTISRPHASQSMTRRRRVDLCVVIYVDTDHNCR
jgi:hypothetical protein